MSGMPWYSNSWKRTCSESLPAAREGINSAETWLMGVVLNYLCLNYGKWVEGVKALR
jgi:hypothetical protein